MAGKATAGKQGVRRVALVALGANLGDAAATLTQASAALSALACDDFAISPYYRTAPVGPVDQPDYVNAACRFVWDGEALPLLRALHQIEQDYGRRRDGVRWGPRTLDLDLIALGELRHDTPELSLPHPRAHERAFVLRPMADVASTAELPGCGIVSELLAKLPAEDRQDVVLLD